MEASSRILLGDHPVPSSEAKVEGELVQYDGESFYRITHAEAMKPFFMSIVSDSNHWLFVASNGGMTAGRQTPKLGLFPYTTEDKIIDGARVTGPYTALLARASGKTRLWHPFREEHGLVYRSTRRLYKNVLGNRVVFEEVNEDLDLCFRYEWRTSPRYGFVRECTLSNRGTGAVDVRVLDGLQNLMPADVDEKVQADFSCLLDAYKKNELCAGSSLALYTLSAQVVDRAEPRESLRATTVWSHGLEGATVLLSSEQNSLFDRGMPLDHVSEVRGRRGAYLLDAGFALPPGSQKKWVIVADVNQSQRQVSELLHRVGSEGLLADLRTDLAAASENLRRIVAATDGLQLTADQLSSAHHFANTLFNDMRGGVYVFGYEIPGRDFASFVKSASRATYARHGGWLESLGEREARSTLLAKIAAMGDADLERLGYEYLPLTFSRRHGDPSRPWNRFDIQVKDEEGRELIGYQGNWRDIFQNWEALSHSFPDFVESIIAKFVNASTVDGYNPYRITQGGIDWEVPEPENPWASIGYWGDHQVIYLLKLLELSRNHHPERLGQLLFRPIFSYANVPYEIRSYEEVLQNPRDTIFFDAAKNAKLSALAREHGFDAKLVQGAGGVYHVTLLEKLLVSVLAKISNFVPGAGLWLNTQRPEWNDANNALVGYGASVVTLCYLERLLGFLSELVASVDERETTLSREVATLLEGTTAILEKYRAITSAPAVDDVQRKGLADELGRSASEYRRRVYAHGFSGKVPVPIARVRQLLDITTELVAHTLQRSRRPDGLFHAYNLLVVRPNGGGFGVDHLSEMLEGQVAALSTRSISGEEACSVLDALAASPMYRPDQQSFTLYPNRRLPSFLEKNVIGEDAMRSSVVLQKMAASGNGRIIERDASQRYRFRSELYNAERCKTALDEVRALGTYAGLDDAEVGRILDIYEGVFNHRAFTGRSGTMFAYEGLGSIYWHMVGKLLLATQERFLAAVRNRESAAVQKRLFDHYYRIRQGIGGFNKRPDVYGAFPLDPYSHTPSHSGARQPGMTGQVKEEVISRLGELGVVVEGGAISFRPVLLRASELLREPAKFETFDLHSDAITIELEPGTLAFTYCQVPVIYHLDEQRCIVLTERDGGRREVLGDTLDPATSAAIFERAGAITRIDVFTRLGR
jgi:hypothetical protein